MDTLPRIKVAAVQASSALLDRDRGAEKTCRLLEKAADLGVQVAVFPECFVPGYPIWLDVHQATSPQAIRLYKALFAASVEIPGPAVARIAEAARKTNIVVVLGVCERRANTTGSLFNSLVFIDGHGRIVGVHRKLVPTLLERLVHAPGHGEMLNVYQTEFGRIGGLICGENSNHLAKFHLMSQGQTIHAAAWPPFFFTKPMSQVIDFVSRAAAYENKVFVINSAGVLDDENLERVRAGETGLPSDLAASSGGSSIVAPTGDMLAGPLLGKEGILSCEIDLQDVVAQKMIHDFAGHYNRSDVFSFSVKKHVGSLGEPEREPQETNSGAAESEGETPA